MLKLAGPIVLALVACAFCWTGTRAQEGRSGSLRVAFIGSSYTYYNNLPCLVSSFARARGRALSAEMLVEGGTALSDHWKKPEVRAAVRQGADALVLQTQSTFGVTYLVDGLDRVSDTSSLLRDARPFADAVAGKPTRLFLFEHWRRLDAPARDQLAIHRAFARAGEALGATVIPVGLAYELAASGVALDTLYDTDGSHPSPGGSYLAALTTYAALTGENPVGLPSAVTCPSVDVATEQVTETLATLRIDSTTAPVLQKAAADAIRTWGDMSARSVPEIVLPEVPAGQPLRNSDLQGVWVGTTQHYPRFVTWPARMELRFVTPSAARLTISFGGRPDDIVRDVTVTTSGTALEFSDPRGPNKSVVMYRGVRIGERLVGVAEFTGAASLAGVGRWTLERPR